MKYDPALLESTKNELIKLLSVIEDMQNGDEEDYACKKNDLRPQKFRSILAACLEQRSVSVNHTPEERIYEILFETVSPAAYPSDLDKTIPYCMEEYLDDQEKDILRRIYWNNDTYEAVSNAYSTNSSNIKKIARNALKKLKNKEAVKYMEFGLNYEEDLKRIRESSTDDGRSENVLRLMNNLPKEIILTHVQAAYLQKAVSLVKQLQNDYSDLYGCDPADTDAGDQMEVTIEACDDVSDSISGMRIDEMELPNRLKNSLQKNNIFTVGELKKYSCAELRKMRGIGNSMLQVLITELDKYDIGLADIRTII